MRTLIFYSNLLCILSSVDNMYSIVNPCTGCRSLAERGKREKSNLVKREIFIGQIRLLFAKFIGENTNICICICICICIYWRKYHHLYLYSMQYGGKTWTGRSWDYFMIIEGGVKEHTVLLVVSVRSNTIPYHK